MTQEERKRLLCKQHRDLLYLILRFGNGAMLLPQLRALCLTLGLYTNGQAVNRAVRDLKESDILTRQTWIDNNSDLILCRKYVYCFFSGKTRSEVATPRRPNTMAPYILQARKVGWLLSMIDKHGLSSLESVEKYITARGCTMFLRLPDLLGYYKRYAALWAKDSPARYREQLAQLAASAEQRSCLARGELPCATFPVPAITTLEKSHRRGLYIVWINVKEKIVGFALFAGREMSAKKLVDWAIDAHLWLASLLPQYTTILTVYALDSCHADSLKSAMTAVAPGREHTPYCRYRLENQRLSGCIRFAITDTDFVKNWCGGISRTN